MAEAHSGQDSLRILVADNDDKTRTSLASCLASMGHAISTCHALPEALEHVTRQFFDLIFAGIAVDSQDALRHIASLIAECPWTSVIAVADAAALAGAEQALGLGAADCLQKPFSPSQVQMVTQKVAERRRLEMQIDALRSALGSLDPEADLHTENALMQRALELARTVAGSNTTVLICGEVGSGKGRLARAIHHWSARRSAPFTEISCDEPNPDVLDAELFGRVRLDDDRPVDAPGRIELTKGGTLALHEIARIPRRLQPKILRFLAEREFERHEDFTARKGDVRVVATSPIDPSAEVSAGRLRPELLLALDVVRIEIPPLRSRPEDVQMLAKRYLAYFSHENRREISGMTPESINALQKYSWPGNTRELRNLIERAVLLCREGEIGLEHLPPNLLNGPAKYGVGDLVSLDKIENLHIQRVLDSTGTIKGAAAVLGIGVSTMVRWMKRAKMAIPTGDFHDVDDATSAAPKAAM